MKPDSIVICSRCDKLLENAAEFEYFGEHGQPLTEDERKAIEAAKA